MWSFDMRNYGKLKQSVKETVNQVNSGVGNLNTVAVESRRVSEVARDVHIIIEDLDKQFEKATKLNSFDIKFLFLATALQCVRQYIFTNDKFRLTANEGDQWAGKIVPKNWHDILLAPVPYDAIAKADIDMESTGLSGITHRYRTLGHDPVMGWIFGPMNILPKTAGKVGGAYPVV
jgi:hypothetical protein